MFPVIGIMWANFIEINKKLNGLFVNDNNNLRTINAVLVLSS